MIVSIAKWPIVVDILTEWPCIVLDLCCICYLILTEWPCIVVRFMPVYAILY